MTMSDAAKIILTERACSMHVKDLVDEIESRKLFKFGAKNPASVLAGALNKKSDIFIRTDPGKYRLK